MTKASARSCTVLSALLLMGAAGPDAQASDRVRSTSSVTLAPSARVTIINSVVNNAPMQTLLLTAAVAPAAMVFAAANAGANANAGAASSAGGRGIRGDGAADVGGAGLPSNDGSALPELIVIGGSLGGATIDGDAVSISVGDVSGGSAGDSTRVPMVIAQYN